MAFAELNLNTRQREAVRSDDTRCLTSCPGSGKTRTIVAKVLRCTEEVRDSPRKVACITYTNAGVNEIESRLRTFGSSTEEGLCDVGTIHSFCLNSVLRPFYYRLPAFRSGFDVCTPCDPLHEELVRDIRDKFGLPVWSANRFETILREPDGRLLVPNGIPEEAASEYLEHMDRNSLVTMNDIVYYSARLVIDHSFISRGIASRYAWILVDEFQDTSASQIAILERVFDHGRTKFFVVGDPNQSIYGFGGAHPELMAAFAKHSNARTDIRLIGNYRSSRYVITHAERLCPSDPAMEAIGENRDYAFEPAYHHAASVLDGVWDYFLPAIDELKIPLGKCAILAPWWIQLFHLGRGLSARDVPVIGPGARPYSIRRSYEFAQFAEHACAYIEQPDAEAATAVQRAMFVMLLNTTGNPDWRVYSYEGKKTLFRLLQAASRLRESHESAVEWLHRAAASFGDILVSAEFLPKAKTNMLTDSAANMVDDIHRNVEDAPNLSTKRLGLFARPGNCITLTTMHRAKGREFDAVAIVDLHDGKVPFFDASPTGVEESRRALYVAVTRARKVLMYFTDSSHPNNTPSRFLGSDGLRLLGQ